VSRLLENELHIFSCVGKFKDVIQCPAGVRGRGDPTGARGGEEAPRHARGKRSTWSANQQPISIDYLNKYYIKLTRRISDVIEQN
jgi:hypothetical protein